MTRQQRAIEAALAVAARHGVESIDPCILHDSNNTVIHLRPAPLVAKAATTPEDADLGRELDVARFLVRRGAPVVPPARLLPPGPHREAGLELTFWEYCFHEQRDPDDEVLG